MVDYLDASGCFFDRFSVSKIGIDEVDVINVGIEVRTFNGSEIVQDADGVSALEQLADEVVPNESCTTGDEAIQSRYSRG